MVCWGGGRGPACADSLAMTGEWRADSANAGSGVPRSAGPVQLALFSTFCRWIFDRCAHFVSLFSDQSICNSPSLSCHLHKHWTRHLRRPMKSFQRNCVLLRYIRTDIYRIAYSISVTSKCKSSDKCDCYNTNQAIKPIWMLLLSIRVPEPNLRAEGYSLSTPLSAVLPPFMKPCAHYRRPKPHPPPAMMFCLTKPYTSSKFNVSSHTLTTPRPCPLL